MSAPSPRALLAVEALRRGLPVEITAGGGSMRPLLRAGDRLTIEPADVRALSVGDVAVVARDGHLVAHRVVSLRPLALRGDACPSPDPPVDAAAVVGRVTRVRRGRLALPLDGRVGRALSRLVGLLARL